MHRCRYHVGFISQLIKKIERVHITTLLTNLQDSLLSLMSEGTCRKISYLWQFVSFFFRELGEMLVVNACTQMTMYIYMYTECLATNMYMYTQHVHCIIGEFQYGN